MRKRNISPERLIEAIKEYIDGKGSFDTIAEKYCIAYETIRNAYERYKENGISTFIETKHNAAYAEELKEKAVMEYLQGEGSQTAIAAKYGLRSKISKYLGVNRFSCVALITIENSRANTSTP